MGSGRASEAGEPRDACARAAELLARRFMFASELARRLADEGFDATACEGAVRRMAELGYVDDVRLAREVADRRTSVGVAKARIALDLMRAGASQQTAEQAASAAWGDRDEHEVAAGLALAWLQGASCPVARVARRLSRLGYGEAVVDRVVERLDAARGLDPRGRC